MLSGRRLDLLDPSPLDVELEDIAHGLARVARWNGQTTGGHVFSVAQHSLLVEAIAAAFEPGLAGPARLSIVLHDAPEYVIGDLITPLKAVIGDGYVAAEARLLRAIRLRFGLPAEPGPDLARLTKRADRAAARLEAVRLAGFSAEEADCTFGPPEPIRAELEGLIRPWPTEEASLRYRDRVAALVR
jgi:hypothetical protein